jgi:septal ring factor EnvC (AmiA/AmiB activator)
MTHRSILSCLFFIVLTAGVAQAATSQSEAKEQLQALRSRIEALKQQLAASEESRSEVVDALRDSERAISEVTRRLSELEKQSDEVRHRLAGLRAESARTERMLEEQRALLSKLLYEQYLSGESEPLRVVLNLDNPNRIARDLRYLAYIARDRADFVGKLRSNLARLKELAGEAQQRTAELAAIVAAQVSEKRRLEREKQERSRVLAKIAQDIRQRQREIGALGRDERRLARLVEQLARIVTRQGGASRLRNERVPGAEDDGSPFERLKGRLRLPVRGELANRFGSPRAGGALTWKGLFIVARPGEEVRAIAAGRVVFADWLRGFGNLLIIDHGSAYMSLYGNNETLLKSVGDAIRGGEPIARVGNSGGNIDSGLYFELRHQGMPLDPLKWVDLP